jgi:xanthine dehydrogenase YagT iron-sulfur-binding subunit
MSGKSDPKSLSRRDFLKGFGTGVVGTSVLLPAIGTATPQADNVKVREFLEAAEPLTLSVNGRQIRVMVEPRTTLAQLLRDKLQLTGTKIVCNNGECGGCTVVMDGKAVYSCHTLALDAAGKEVITVEGLMEGEKLGAVQEAFYEKDGYQCGFCTPGQVMAAYALLLKNKQPEVDEIKYGMSGNLCRCAAYPKIIDSVQAASEKMGA